MLLHAKLEYGQDVCDIEIAMGDWDDNENTIALNKIEDVFSRQVGEDQEKKIDATDDGHSAEAAQGSFHSETLILLCGGISTFASLIEGRP